MSDIDHLRGWIGRSEQHRETITESFAAKFYATFDLPQDDTGPLPPLAHLALAQPTVPTADLAEDGHARKGGFLPPVTLPRRMWAGGDITLHAPLHIGATVVRDSQIVDVTAKTGRSGTLVFVTVRHVLHADGALAVTEIQDLVYRAAPTGPTVIPAPVTPPAAQHARTIPMSEALLLRYSALTFNTHRIHYDAPYTRDIEGYSGLVIHGPMQATLLAMMADDLARADGATGLRHFRFRGLSPALLPGDLELRADISGATASLTSRQSGGPVCTEAQAGW